MKGFLHRKNISKKASNRSWITSYCIIYKENIFFYKQSPMVKKNSLSHLSFLYGTQFNLFNSKRKKNQLVLYPSKEQLLKKFNIKKKKLYFV